MQAMAFATVGDREPERAPGEGMHPSVFNMALAALANLAAEPSNADLIGEEDGVEMTVEAVSAALDSASVHGEEPDQEMLLHAAEVLRNLASSAMNRQRIVRSGGMGLVVGEAAGSPADGAHTSDMTSATLHLLARLAEDAAVRDTVLVWPSAVAHVHTGMAAFPEHAGVQESACRFLSTLLQAADDEEHSHTAVALDKTNTQYFAMAARAVHRHHADAGLKDACWALYQGLAQRRWRQEPSTASSGSSESLVTHLVRDLQHVDAAGGADSAAPEVAAMLEMACMKLTEIAVDEMEVMLEMNVTEALLRGVAQHAENTRAMQMCCMAIWQLAGDLRTRQALNRRKAGPLVAQVLTSATKGAQRMHQTHQDGDSRTLTALFDFGLRALVLLAEDEQCAQDIVLSSRAVSGLCRFVSKGGGDEEKESLLEDLDVQEQAGRLVQVLATSVPALASELVWQGALDMLFAIAGSRDFSDGRTKQQACVSLSSVLSAISGSKAQKTPPVAGMRAEWLTRISSSLTGHGTDSGVLEECLTCFTQYFVHHMRAGPEEASLMPRDALVVAGNAVAAIHSLRRRQAR